MKRQAYRKPEAWALIIQQSGLVCDSLTSVNGEGFDYGGPGGDNPAQARSGIWEDEELYEENNTDSDQNPLFDKDAFLSVLR